MPTDPSAGLGDVPPAEVLDDELTFALHDLGRERAAGPVAGDLGFVAATRVDAPKPPPAEDGFVIHQPQGVAPAAPVDTLVVGAPEPVAATTDEVPALSSFKVGSVPTASAARATPEELWTTRGPAPAPVSTTSRRGWSTRHTQLVDRSAQATMLRLREEAVNVSWKAAWLAVTSAEPRLLRKRRASSSWRSSS